MTSTRRFAVFALLLAFGIGDAAAAGKAAGPNVHTRQGKGSAVGAIRGAIHYPKGKSPAMRVCAVGQTADGQDAHVCAQVARGATQYQIDGLAPGDYSVIAEPRGGALRVGGHVQQVQCIRAPCPEMPSTVHVRAAVLSAGVDLNGFFEARQDFPALPSER